VYPERREDLKQLFEQAYVLPAEERAAFLDESCSDDPTIRAELDSLLAAGEKGEPFFDSLARAVNSLSPWDEAPAGDESASDPLIGRTVHQYLIEEQLGGGGMGVVYRAHDTELDRAVALKFLPPHLSANEAAKERFLVEARAAAALDHPNVCAIHEVGEDEDGRLFIAMACYEGETLEQKLERGPLPIEEAWDYARQIAAGLAAAHAHDIIHRDIKPGNVIVTPEGLAKVLDFGLAKLTDVTLTGTGTTLGTVAYMSPEQAQGNVVDQRTDLWSLGVVLYEMLTGERPFRGGQTAAVIHSIVHEDPKPPSDLRPEIPAELEAIVGRLLAKNPEERSATAEDLGLDGGPATLPKGVFAKPTGWAWLRSRRGVVAVAAVVVVALAGWWSTRLPPTPPSGPIRSVAVLPLLNLSGDPEQDDFVDAMHQAAIAELSLIGELTKVIHRQSVLAYRDTDLSIPEIARELDVDAVIEGSVLRIEDVVTISAQVTGADPETRLLTERFEGSMGDVFALHGELARAVARVIGAALTPQEEARFARPEAVNPDAYIFYTRGNEYIDRSLNWADIRPAIQLYEQAIAADPGFAHAHGMLALALGISGHAPPFELNTDSVLSVVERALALDPDLPEAHAVLGWLSRDSVRKWEEFEIALKTRASPEIEARVHDLVATALRARGRWEEATRHHERAVELNPRSIAHLLQLSAPYLMIRDYDAYERTIERTMALAPTSTDGLWSRAYLALQRDGDAEAARQWFAQAARAGSPVDLINGLVSWYYRTPIPLLDDDLRAEILSAPVDRFTDVQHPPSYYYIVRATLLEQENRAEAARAYYDSARAALEPEVVRLTGTRSVARLRMRLAFAYAGLGRKEQAIQTARQGISEFKGGALFDWLFKRWLAEIYVMLDDPDAAIDLLESLLQQPSFVSVPYLRAHPTWEPLRDHPRFQALLEREQ